jgi:hypothetical protein
VNDNRGILKGSPRRESTLAHLLAWEVLGTPIIGVERNNEVGGGYAGLPRQLEQENINESWAVVSTNWTDGGFDQNTGRLHVASRGRQASLCSDADEVGIRDERKREVSSVDGLSVPFRRDEGRKGVELRDRLRR